MCAGFLHDGKTTYCWRIPASYTVKQPQWTDTVVSGEAKACPISMTLQLEAPEVTAGEFVAVNWTVTLEKERLSNSSDIKQGSVIRIPDESSDELVDVIHSNVHSCEFGSNCDPFRMGTRFMDNTPNKVGTFPSGDNSNATILFASTEELLFPSAGIYSVLAHIILPGANTSNERFDYAVYQRITVKEKASNNASTVTVSKSTGSTSEAASGSSDETASAEKSSSSSSSTSGFILGIVGGVVAVLVLVGVAVVVKRRRATLAASSALTPHGGVQPRVLRPVDKTLNALHNSDGNGSDASVVSCILGLEGSNERLGALRPAPYPRYLTSTDHAAEQQPHRAHRTEMDIREFNDTYDNTSSYHFIPDGKANPVDNAHKRPHNIVGLEYSVDLVYPTTTTRGNGDLLLNPESGRFADTFRSDDTYLRSGPNANNDSYVHFGAAENYSMTSSRVFSSASEGSDGVDDDMGSFISSRRTGYYDSRDIEH
jgi:hypothetical protein|uniref:Uncharacterized protein n=1 Tax=Globisporangium ultimum (strain ATCC 200006 / CBS 805.95 / DAOM BR144) TaxID=431595 RepID=K3WMU8_GLOUD